MLRRVRLVTWFFAALWAAPVFSSGTPPLPVRTVNVTAASAAVHANPEAATGYAERELAYAQHFMVSAANPIAARAGADILAAGGSAADAAIATQLVLNIVEPQSSGIGGGGFIVNFDAASGQVQAYDGRETAPRSVDAELFLQDGAPMQFREAVNSGRSVGAPGLVRALAMLHGEHGRLPWAQLFEPAIAVAEQGFAVSPRLHGLLSDNDALRAQADAAAYFYDEQGQPWPVGHLLKNPALARVYRTLAQQGPDAFYTGWLADRMVQAVQEHAVPGQLQATDLEGYRAVRREPLCMPYKVYTLCGMPPPSAGPLAVMQILGILSHTEIDQYAPDSLQAVHYFSEAGRLAFADRDAWVADPDFVDVPVSGLLDPDYLQARAALIDAHKSMGKARAGSAGAVSAPSGQTLELPATTHLAVADADGNVVSMTTSIESAFGSKIFVEGFLLNNQLTDFSFSATGEDGAAIANRVEPGKRPRSSMAPMLVLHNGKPVMAIGSPGGSAIINYVAKAILGVLDWNLDIQQAIDQPHYGSRNYATELEQGSAIARHADALRAMGHEVRELDFPSGLQGLVLTPTGIQGGADPRREGLAIGQ
ncbi:MAG TPA: gamma-glutamyltransferase [Burkholderiaceae bacterium]|nr:gamma-glutamyltransferase [Burkholderiaceae bacterium]